MTAVARVFISFSSKDAETADRLVAHLERAGQPCWIASRDIAAGSSYPAAITAAVTSASAILLLLSDTSNVSKHVLSEIELAFNAGKPILPVRLSPVPLSPDLQYFLGRTQWFDVGPTFDDDDAAKLRGRLASLIAGHEAPRVAVVAPPGRPRRLVLAGGALASIAALFVVIMLRQQARVEPPPPTTTATNTATPAPAGAVNGAAPAAASAATADAPVAVATPPPEATVRPRTPSPKTKLSPRDGATYVWIAPGVFTLGCSPGDTSCERDEGPSHSVRVRKGFWLGRTEVTNGQIARLQKATSPPTSRDFPAVELTWAEARDHCTAVGGRLPREFEWEFAARGGTTGARYEPLGDIAWFGDNSDGRAHRVGEKRANPWGLVDMLGNVHEWVADRYFNAYDDTDSSLIEPLASNASGVTRGGAFSSEAINVRVSKRRALPPDGSEPTVGFRCAMD